MEKSKILKKYDKKNEENRYTPRIH